SRIGSPAGPRAATYPVPTKFGAVASLGFARGPGGYLDPISPRFAADFPPTAQTVGLGVFVTCFFLCPKVGVIPTQPLIHNSMPLMKKAAPTPRDNQRNQRLSYILLFLLYGAHFVTRAVCQVRVGAPPARYVTPPACAAAVETICGGFGGGGCVARPKRRFVNFSLVCARLGGLEVKRPADRVRRAGARTGRLCGT